MIKASVYIICKNEEKHIFRVLESVKDFDEIIIVDSGSSDKTLEIARKYTDKIYHQEWLGFSRQKEYAKTLCKNEWVLNLDADEELTKKLKDEIIKLINDNVADGLEIRISSKQLGSFNHQWSKLNTRVRFFRKHKGYYPTKLVHESIVIQGNIIRAKGFILDYGAVDLETSLNKINLYSTLRAKEKFSKNKKPSLMKLIFLFPLAFIKSFIIKRGFLNGAKGLILAANAAYYSFVKEAKLYELWIKNHDKNDFSEE